MISREEKEKIRAGLESCTAPICSNAGHIADRKTRKLLDALDEAEAEIERLKNEATK